MIARLRDPDPKPPTEATPGRVQGLVEFARAVVKHAGGALDGLTVLDVGGADGLLEAHLGIARVLGYWTVDVRPYPLSDAVADAHALPFRGRSVDVVVSKQTLPQFRDPVGAVREMLRVARALVVVRQDWDRHPTHPHDDSMGLYRGCVTCGHSGFVGEAPTCPGSGRWAPIGWEGHSRVRIDAPEDILLPLLAESDGSWKMGYREPDFVFRRAR